MNDIQQFLERINANVDCMPDVDVLADMVDRLHDHIVDLRIDDEIGHEKYGYLVAMVNLMKLSIETIRQSQGRLKELSHGINIIDHE